VLQATGSEGLAQGPYVVAGVGFESLTLWTQGTELTSELPLHSNTAAVMNRALIYSAPCSLEVFVGLTACVLQCCIVEINVSVCGANSRR